VRDLTKLELLNLALLLYMWHYNIYQIKEKFTIKRFNNLESENNMKERIAKVMRSGGWAVLVAVIAMALYLLVLELAEKAIVNMKVDLIVTIDENGYLSTNYQGDKEDVYILWETDGGSVVPVEQEEKLKDQHKEGNKWYIAYTKVDGKVKWSPLDADGNEYETATVRATIYLSNKQLSTFYVYEYINEASITLNKTAGNVSRVSDRVFSNPVRKGTDSNWSQVYEISAKDDKNKVYRFRTGMQIDMTKEWILCFETEEEVLSEANLIKGGIYGYEKIGETTKLSKAINNILVSSEIANKEGFSLSAYLTSKSNYNLDNIEEAEKYYKANLTAK
jgi:hypothetical protein